MPVIAPVMWFHWDTTYYIFGGDTPTWASFSKIIEWHFPYLWDEFDGAGHPLAYHAAIPTAIFFWVLAKLGVPILVAQMSFFITLSALSAIGIYRIGKLFFNYDTLPVFVFVTTIFYLLNTFGFYGEGRRIFTTEFIVGYYLLPLFVSYILTAIENSNLAVREALLAGLTSVALHNFNLTPAVSYVGISYFSIAIFYVIFQKDKSVAILKFFVIFISVSFLLLAYQLFAMFHYYQVSDLAANLETIVPTGKRSTADLLVRTLMFSAWGREISSPLLVVAYLLPLFVAVTAFFGSSPKRLVLMSAMLLVSSLFLMDAGKLATKLFSINEITYFIYGIFRFPHIKFTAPYILSIALLCGIAMARFTNKKITVVIASVLFILLWNPRAYTEWLPIQLHKPDDWLGLSVFLQHERAVTPPARTLKIPSIEYFRDGVGGDEFGRTPPFQKDGARPWMVHSTVLGLLLPDPIFSLDMTIGARLNPCVTRIFRDELNPKEMSALLNILGIERVLLSKKFTYQNQFTPAEYKEKMRRLVNRIQYDIPYSNVLFENDGVKLSTLAMKPLPVIYIAKQVQRISPQAISTCSFTQSAENNQYATAFYADTLPDGAAKLLSGLTLGHAEVDFKRLTPDKYRVQLSGISGFAPIVLVLNNTYADWVIEPMGLSTSNEYFRNRRFQVNGFATAWVLDAPSLCKSANCKPNSAGGYDLDLFISYGPQKIYQSLLFGTILASLIILLFVFFTGRSAAPKKTHLENS